MGIGKWFEFLHSYALTNHINVGTNWEKVRSIEQEPIPECDELRRLGVLR
jgi:hypothetical protein